LVVWLFGCLAVWLFVIFFFWKNLSECSQVISIFSEKQTEAKTLFSAESRKTSCAFGKIDDDMAFFNDAAAAALSDSLIFKAHIQSACAYKTIIFTFLQMVR
jgi:hypothetical protein